MMTAQSREILDWLQLHPQDDGYTLRELSAQFELSTERMRDQLRRLVDAGYISQSDPIPGFADANPIYALQRAGAEAIEDA